jgi:hypothetical protein
VREWRGIYRYREEDRKQQCVREEKGEIDRESKKGSNSV